MVHFLNRMLAGTGRPSAVLERSSSAAVTFALVFGLGVASTAVFSHRLRTVLQRPKRLRVVNRLMGSLLVGMGALMAAVR
jgi:threonine/homoserine/homoserine lactone efflux protein